MTHSMRYQGHRTIADADTLPSSRPRMSSYAPELSRFLRDHLIRYVRAEYTGREDRGEFVALHFVSEDGHTSDNVDSTRRLQVETTMRTLLLVRYPPGPKAMGLAATFGGTFRPTQSFTATTRWDLRAIV